MNNKQKPQNMSKRNLTIIAASIVAVITVSLVTMLVSDTADDHIVQDSEQLAMRGPGPSPLSMYGNDLPPKQAINMTGFDIAKLPSKIEPNLTLESVRVRDYSPSYLMTAFYVPPENTATDTDTFEDIIANGGIIIIYSEEPTSPSYDPQKWREGFVNAASDVRKLSTINGHPAILVTGNQEQKINSQVLVYVDNLQIDIVSLQHNTQELMNIAELVTAE